MSKLPVNFSASVINIHPKAAHLFASAQLPCLVCPGLSWSSHCCLLLGFLESFQTGLLPFTFPPAVSSQLTIDRCFWNIISLTTILCSHCSNDCHFHWSSPPPPALPRPIGSILTSTCYFFGFSSWVYSISSVQSLSPVGLFVAPRTAARQDSLSIINSQSLLKFMFIKLVMPSNHLILCSSSCLQPYPASESFLIIQFFASGGQRIVASASASVLSMNIQDWSPLGWTGWISLQSKGLSRLFTSTTVKKNQFFSAQLSL